MNILPLRTLQRYVLIQFLMIFLICLFAVISLFLIFDLFERSRVFIREGTTITQAASYLLFKIPLVIQLMTPVAALVATLITIGRLSQLSEVTAMRACGISILWLSKPLILFGLVLSVVMFWAGETIVPWATERVEEIYHVDIRKKLERGAFSRDNFWYRAGNKFFNIGLYDSVGQRINAVSIYEFDEDLRLVRRIDADYADWNELLGWQMRNAVETRFSRGAGLQISSFRAIPLVIEERPEDFYNLQRKPETLSYQALGDYIEKLREEGVPVTEYKVQRAAKISFPFVNVIVVLIAIPFALIPARSGSLTISFVAGITIGLGYHVVHAIITSLGGAELIPVIPAAWAANIILGCVGGYMLAAAEYP